MNDIGLHPARDQTAQQLPGHGGDAAAGTPAQDVHLPPACAMPGNPDALNGDATATASGTAGVTVGTGTGNAAAGTNAAATGIGTAAADTSVAATGIATANADTTATATAPPSPPQDGIPVNERLGALVATAIGVAMSSLDTAIANTALPAIASQLGTTPADSVWVVTVYQLAMVATLLPAAALGETLGYRRVFLFGLGLFTAASLACACAWSLPTLVLARLFQGVGAAALMGVNTALLRAIFPASMLGRALGTNAMVVATGFALGPTLASSILAFWSWPWLFAINVPLGVVAIFLGRRTLPHTARAAHKVDLLTALYNVFAFGFLILALGEGAHLAAPKTIAAELAVALGFFLLLLRRQAGQKAPLLPVDLLRLPLFSLSILTAVFTFATQGLAFVSLPFYFETTLARSPIETGFLMTPWAVLVWCMAPVAGRLSDRYSPGLLCGIGLVLLSAGMLTLVNMPLAPTVFDICWRMALCGIGFGFFQAPNLKAIMLSAPPQRSGGASGSVGMARLLGQSSGGALVALCFSISSVHGGAAALWLGAGFAAVACVASFSRLLVGGVQA